MALKNHEQWNYLLERVEELVPKMAEVEYVHQSAFTREFNKLAKYRYGMGL